MWVLVITCEICSFNCRLEKKEEWEESTSTNLAAAKYFPVRPMSCHNTTVALPEVTLEQRAAAACPRRNGLHGHDDEERRRTRRDLAKSKCARYGRHIKEVAVVADYEFIR